VPNRPLRECNARKNPGIADDDTKRASVRAGFPAQRTKVESDSLRGPNERTWSHTATECRQLPRLRSSRLDWGQLQPPHSIVIGASESNSAGTTANETVRSHWHALVLSRRSYQSEET
jgi:hypothetical protein